MTATKLGALALGLALVSGTTGLAIANNAPRSHYTSLHHAHHYRIPYTHDAASTNWSSPSWSTGSTPYRDAAYGTVNPRRLGPRGPASGSSGAGISTSRTGKSAGGGG
jgi:hypothetical protein